ncbi:uncharacterized protein ARMOST_22302 [Armillaria ostoyae]|uniref:Uncharacterized protein n=1 Tax=Armillaria ostoyae TaxID=47428 RepID=A0A284SCH4_ARMOS|nr:uncharacterized protein ARMOST_22302 [Armillaria ostoyae]
MLGLPDPGAAVHRMARISDFEAASNAPNADSMLDLGTTRSGSVFKQWEDIKEYMVDVDLNDVALSLPQPTAERASDVELQPVPLSGPNPSKPSPQPMSSSNATPIPEHLHGRQHKSFKSHQKKPLRIINNQGRVIVYIVGHPKEFDKVSKETIEVFERVEKSLSLNAVHTHHRRGDYGFVSTSISFGGGQTRPGNLRNSVNNESIMEELLSNWAVQHVVQFINKAFAAIHPELWKCYQCLLDDLTNAHPYLSWIFDRAHSVFASCTLNIGGVTTHRHRDHLNLGLGACPIFAIGDFNHTKGSHLVLWDLKLVIEFPSGTLIIIPSALLEHSNTLRLIFDSRLSDTLTLKW